MFVYYIRLVFGFKFCVPSAQYQEACTKLLSTEYKSRNMKETIYYSHSRLYGYFIYYIHMSSAIVGHLPSEGRVGEGKGKEGLVDFFEGREGKEKESLV